MNKTQEFREFEAQFKSIGLTMMPALPFWLAGIKDVEDLRHMTDSEVRTRVHFVGDRRIQLLRTVLPYEKGDDQNRTRRGRAQTQE